MTTLRRQTTRKIWIWLILLAVVLLAFLMGLQASQRWLIILLVGLGVLALLVRPSLGLFAIVAAALLISVDIATGTRVSLNIAALLVPVVLAIWFLDRVRHKDVSLVPSSTYMPLILFLLASLLSLLIGIATWDKIVPRSSGFIFVQMAQWAIFAFSAAVFILTANLIQDEEGLNMLTRVFLLLAGVVIFLGLLPGIGGVVDRFTTITFIRAPFWALLAALAGGQLFYNQKLTPAWHWFLATLLLYTIYYSFVVSRGSSSTWVGVGVSLGVLVWLRYPRLRWLVVLSVFVTAAAGVLLPALWNFAGGDTAWIRTGGSRVALTERVLEVTMRNPLTGLGPAAYRPYANATPLIYEHIIWAEPRVSSHNNYVDLFAHGGLLGLMIFGWFCWELYRLGRRLHYRFTKGFSGGYVNAMIAVGVSSLFLMLLADWILPFVYNIGFPGFQASVLIWLFMGGLVALDQFPPPQQEDHEP